MPEVASQSAQGPSTDDGIEVRLRTEKVTLRNDSGLSPRESGEQDVVQIYEERQ